MSMFALTPFRRQDLESRLNSLLDTVNDDLFNLFDNSFTSVTKTAYPKVDITESPDKFTINATVPGLVREDIKIDITDEQGQKHLSIRADKQEQKDVETKTILKKEIHRSSFCRIFSLPENIEEEKIVAQVKNGILTIDIPKKMEAKSLPKTRTIAIQ